MSKAIPKEQVRDDFLQHIRAMVEYWDTVECERSQRERLSGLAFSILNIFDGTTIEFCAMDITLRPHPEDKQYHIDNEDDYFEDGMVINDDTMLHELFYK